MRSGVLFAVLATVAVVFAHEVPTGTTHKDPVRFWTSYGQGLGSILLAGEMNVAFQTGHHLFTARAAATGMPFWNAAIGDWGLLYGLSTTDRYTSASASVGLSYVSGQLSDRRVRTVGIPVEANFTVVPCAYVGLGAGVFGNLNFTQPFCGGVVFLRAGKLR